MAVPGQSAGITNGWRFIVFACLGIVVGSLLIAAAEALNGAHLIAPELRDAALVLGGAAFGLTALCVNEVYRVLPELERLQREREVERVRHQEERRTDFEEYRALQTELEEMRAHATALQSKLDLAGALDRERVGDALLMGFYFHRRDERLPSAPKESIFRTAAARLKVVSGTTVDVKLDKATLHDVIEIAYGLVVAEAFDLGYVLSHLGEDGVVRSHDPDVLAELEKHLKAVRFNTPASPARTTQDLSALLRGVVARVGSFVCRP